MVTVAKLRAVELTPIPKPSIRDRLGDLKNKGKARSRLRILVPNVARENADTPTIVVCEAISSKTARKPYMVATTTTLRHNQQ